MAEQLMVYEWGDRLATITPEGRARIWVVNQDGYPLPAEPHEFVPPREPLPPPTDNPRE